MIRESSSAAKKDRLEYMKFHWKGSEIYRFSHSAAQNFLCRSTMVADIFEDFELNSLIDAKVHLFFLNVVLC